jgi:hypothetical protein
MVNESASGAGGCSRLWLGTPDRPIGSGACNLGTELLAAPCCTSLGERANQTLLPPLGIEIIDRG